MGSSTAPAGSGTLLPTAPSRADPRRLANWLAGILIGIGTVIRIPQLFHDLVEAYAFRQTQTAFTVREYSLHGIDLTQSPLPVFGPDASVPMEWPIFQAIASLLTKIGFDPTTASRTLGLISFEVAALLLFLILRKWHGRAVAITALVLFEFLPYALLWGASSLIDFMSVALALALVYFLDRWFDGGRGRWWFLLCGAVAAVLCALVKITTFPDYGILVLAAAIVLIRREGWRASWLRLGLGLVAAPLAGLVAGLLWTRYADSIKAAHEITQFVTSSALNDWNFGTIAQRLDPENYLTILNRLTQEMAGPALIGAILAILAAILQRGYAAKLHTWGWIAASVAAPLVFFNLYVVHDYYLIGVFAPIVAATSIGLVWLWRVVAPAIRRPVMRVLAGVVGIAIFVAASAFTPNGSLDVYQWAKAGQIPDQVKAIDATTQPGDLIVTVGCDWDPTWLYTAEREGVMFRSADSQHFWDDHSIGDYEWLFSCSGATDTSVYAPYLPAGTRLEPTQYPYIYRISA